LERTVEREARMTIGELARRAGVNAQTVRYYERRGLLPQPDRTRNGYRSYGEEDLHRLRFILRSKALGFTLKEVGELVDLRVDPRRTAEDVRVRALEKIADTEAKIRDLEAIRSALRRLVDRCAAHGRPDECALMHAIGADDDDSGRG
jgi:MerR family transcriptional regulator, copper efflux regulator